MKQDDSQPTGADANNEAPKHDPMDSHFWKKCDNPADGNEYFDTAVVPVKSDETELIAELRNAKDSDSTKFIRGEIERVGDDFNYGHKWKFKPGTIEIGDFPDDESSGDYCSPNEDIDHWVDVIGKLTIRKKFKTGEEHHRKPKRIPKSSDHLHIMKYDDDEGKFILEDSIRVQGTGDEDFTFAHGCQFGQEFIIVKCETRGGVDGTPQAPSTWDTFVFFKEVNGWSRAADLESVIEGDTTSFLPTDTEGPWPGDDDICQDCALWPKHVSYKLNRNTNNILMHVRQNVHLADHVTNGNFAEPKARFEKWFVLEFNATEKKFNVTRSISREDLIAHRTDFDVDPPQFHEHTINFSMQLDDNDDLLASVRQTYKRSVQLTNNSGATTFRNYTKHKSHISKYVYNESEGKYEHLASGKDLFGDIHPLDGEQGPLNGSTSIGVNAPWHGEIVYPQPEHVIIRDVSGNSLVATYKMIRWWRMGHPNDAPYFMQNCVVFYEMDPETKKYTTTYEHPIDQDNGHHVISGGVLNVDVEGDICVISSHEDYGYFSGAGSYAWFKKTDTTWQYMGVLDMPVQETSAPDTKRRGPVDQDVSFKLSGDFFIACVQDSKGPWSGNPPVMRYIIYKLENDEWSEVHVLHPTEEIGYQLGHDDSRRPHHTPRDYDNMEDIAQVDWIHVIGDGADRIILT